MATCPTQTRIDASTTDAQTAQAHGTHPHVLGVGLDAVRELVIERLEHAAQQHVDVHRLARGVLVCGQARAQPDEERKEGGASTKFTGIKVVGCSRA